MDNSQFDGACHSSYLAEQFAGVFAEHVESQTEHLELSLDPHSHSQHRSASEQ